MERKINDFRLDRIGKEDGMNSKQKTIILYGAGKRCLSICSLLKSIPDYEVMFIVDSNCDKWGKRIGNWEIVSPELIGRYSNSYLCITVARQNDIDEIRHKLKKGYSYDASYEIDYEQLLFELLKKTVELKSKEDLGDDSCKQTVHRNIIFDCYRGLGLGGIESWTKDVCLGLLDRNWRNISILSSQKASGTPLELVKLIDTVQMDNTVLCEESDFGYVIDYLLEHLPCIVVANYRKPVLMAACILKRKYPNTLKIISVIHGGTEDIYRHYMIYKNHVDLFVGVSQDIYAAMIKKGIKREKIYAMSCPFECEQKLLRNYSTDNSCPICIGYAGRMDGMEYSQKRMDLVLKLMTELVDRNVNYKMELAGDGPVRAQMEKFVLDKGLGDKVIFLGRLERRYIADFWKKQDIAINLSDCEGRSISMLEAMANGAVPVLTDVSGTREDVINEINGYIVPLGDYHMMADRIEYLSTHRERLQKLGQAAHDAVYPKSSLDKHLDFWEKILSELSAN